MASINHSPGSSSTYDWKSCAACKTSKFWAGPSSHVSTDYPILQRINEFPPTDLWPGQAVLCSQWICSKCISLAISRTAEEGLFRDLDQPMARPKCPVRGCDEFLPVSHVAGMANVLRRLGSQPGLGDLESQIAKWDRTTSFRRAITSCQPRPSVPALEMAALLYEHLVRWGFMKSVFDPCFPDRSTTPDEEGRLADFTPGPIKMLSVEDKGGATSLLVPFFMKFFKRQSVAEARQCRGCLEWLCEIDYYGANHVWIQLCSPFPGSWKWNILAFPDMLAYNCHHEMDICTKCLVESIKTTMNEKGVHAVGKIPCPTEGCGRKLLNDEIQCYADKETKEKYDRFLHIKSISQLPNFRWCSRDGCENGQTFEPEEVKEGLPVQCGKCGFDMCFSHQVPWHQGMTCEGYNNCRGQTDPAFNHTQRWMQQNVKTCPGVNCGIPITKEDGCFHMECE